jgi:threonine dehydratase
MEEPRLPTRAGVIAAADRIAPWVTRTPLLPLDWQGRRLWAKAECLQQGGAFKLRGATNRLLQLTEEERNAASSLSRPAITPGGSPSPPAASASPPPSSCLPTLRP